MGLKNIIIKTFHQTKLPFYAINAYSAYLMPNVHPGRWQGSYRSASSAHPAKITFFIHIFGAFNEIIKQRTFSFIFSIPR